MKDWHETLQALLQSPSPKDHETRACFCVGPQNGNPVCPCRMAQYEEDQLAKRALEYVRKKGIKL